MTWRAMLPAAVAIIVLLAGCASRSADDVINDAETSLRDLTSGRLDMRLVVEALEGDAGTTGFEMSGSFALPEGDQLPTMDLTYTHIVGEQQEAATVQSAGERMFVTVDGTTTELSEEQLAPLRGSSGETVGLPSLGLREWFIEPSLDEDGETVTGELDLAAAMTGLAQFTGALGAGDTLGGVELDEDAAQRLRDRLTNSQVTLSLTDQDRLLQRLAFTGELAGDADIPAELRGGRFEFELSLEDHNQPVASATPSGN